MNKLLGVDKAASAISDKLPEAAKTIADKLPEAAKQLSANLPEAAKQLSANLPEAARELSANLPEAAKQLALNLPEAARSLGQSIQFADVTLTLKHRHSPLQNRLEVVRTVAVCAIAVGVLVGSVAFAWNVYQQGNRKDNAKDERDDDVLV